jgi:hypothetical protein
LNLDVKESFLFPPSAFTVGEEIEALLRTLPDCGSAQNSVPEDRSVAAVPEFLAPVLDTCRDWHGMTLREALHRAVEVTGTELSCVNGFFWRALIRGGVQGAVYAIDSQGGLV